MTTTALILAAGMGRRLRPLTESTPKALVPVGDQPLLGRLLTSCRDAGLTRSVIVTGYRHEDIDRWIASTGFDTLTVYNSEYETINNAHSVLVARKALAGESFVKLDGDLLLTDARLLRKLIDDPRATAALVDTTAELDEEAMKAAVEDGFVTSFGKWLTVDQASGESIGVEKIGAEDSPAFFDAIDRVVHREGNHDAYYEDVYHRLISEGWKMGACDTGGVPWTEIDDHTDLERAQRLASMGRASEC